MAKEKIEQGPFARRPVSELVVRKYDILRCRQGKVVKGIMLAGDVCGAYTHWYGGRTLPCNGLSCPACKMNVEVRWHGYLPLYNTSTRNIVIAEITTAAVEPIDRWFREKRSLRGAFISIMRGAERVNSPLKSRVEEGPLPAEALPNPPHVREILEKMWGTWELRRRKGDDVAAEGVLRMGDTLPGQTEIPEEFFDDNSAEQA